MQTNQKEEIKTIKERNIVLNLSDKDCERISRKAATVGLTVSEFWNPEHPPFDEEMSKIMEWNENLENMKEGE